MASGNTGLVQALQVRGGAAAARPAQGFQARLMGRCRCACAPTDSRGCRPARVLSHRCPGVPPGPDARCSAPACQPTALRCPCPHPPCTQGALGRMVGQSSGFIEELPAPVQTRIKVRRYRARLPRWAVGGDRGSCASASAASRHQHALQRACPANRRRVSCGPACAAPLYVATAVPRRPTPVWLHPRRYRPQYLKELEGERAELYERYRCAALCCAGLPHILRLRRACSACTAPARSSCSQPQQAVSRQQQLIGRARRRRRPAACPSCRLCVPSPSILPPPLQRGAARAGGKV